MNYKLKKSGLSLTEITVIIATIAILVGLSVPAVRAFIKSLETGSSTKSIINSALFNARAIAAKEHRYAGVRFQKAYRPEGPLDAPQYMVFIIYDSDDPPNGTGLANGFRAVEGLKPIRLPDTIGVMDLRYRTNSDPTSPDDALIDENDDINSLARVRDTTTFSIVFSQSGRLVIHEVRVRNRHGRINDSSDDDIFNTKANVDADNAMFYQDDYSEDPLNLGLGQEYSRNSFIIYEQKEFKRAYESGQAWSGHLSSLEPLYINAYMGTIIE